MTYICLVCGYNQLLEPPEDYAICPCCGTQFGYHDSGATYEELRSEWRAAGAPWHSRRVLPPANWNPIEQLKRAGYWSESYAPSAQSFVHIDVPGENNISTSVRRITSQTMKFVELAHAAIQSGVTVS